jgi:predicted  nucleic acid-binding Zn-ribbon protein
VGDLKCPKCGNNSFQVRSDDQRAVTFICVACWVELRLEDMTRDFVKHTREPHEG